MKKNILSFYISIALLGISQIGYAQALRSDEFDNPPANTNSSGINININTPNAVQTNGNNINIDANQPVGNSLSTQNNGQLQQIRVQPMNFSQYNQTQPLATVDDGSNQQQGQQINTFSTNNYNNSSQSINGIEKLPPLPDIPTTAFENARDALTPVTKDEINLIKKDIEDTKRLLKTPTTNRKPVIRDQVIDLSAGSAPPLVRPGKNYGSVITFIDETGAPWNIVGADGMSNDFKIRWASGTFNKKRTAIQVVPSVDFGHGNISVMLEGMEIPIIVSVEIGYTKEIDYRVDFRIPLRSPNARAEVAPMPMPSNLPRYVGDIMQGVVPSYAKRLQVSENEGVAYLVEGKLVWRTNLMLLSPIPIGYLPSINGTRVYYMEYTPVLFASDINGNRKQITITETFE